MKKIMISLAALVVSAPVFATSACLGAGADATISPATTAKFIVTQFTQKCSANVILNYDESDTVVVVASASKKGKTGFTGTSSGGAITGTACSGNVCTDAPTLPSTGATSGT